MQNDRLRVPIDGPYLKAVGLAMICFARLEWDAVWCCEKIQPEYIKTVGKKTAGKIATDLLALAAGYPDPAVVSSLNPGAAEFKRLVDLRNSIMHASLGTFSSKEQRLFRHGVELTIEMIDDASDAFVAAGGTLNHHHHHIL